MDIFLDVVYYIQSLSGVNLLPIDYDIIIFRSGAFFLERFYSTKIPCIRYSVPCIYFAGHGKADKEHRLEESAA